MYNTIHTCTTKHTGIPTRIQKRKTRYRRKTGYTYVQWRIRVCRRAAVYSCTTQLTDIQRFLYTRYEVSQSGLVDIYAAFEVVCCATQSPLLGMHSWDGIAKEGGITARYTAMWPRAGL
jgi:hypothetical protein